MQMHPVGLTAFSRSYAQVQPQAKPFTQPSDGKTMQQKPTRFGGSGLDEDQFFMIPFPDELKQPAWQNLLELVGQPFCKQMVEAPDKAQIGKATLNSEFGPLDVEVAYRPGEEPTVVFSTAPSKASRDALNMAFIPPQVSEGALKVKFKPVYRQGQPLQFEPVAIGTRQDKKLVFWELLKRHGNGALGYLLQGQTLHNQQVMDFRRRELFELYLAQQKVKPLSVNEGFLGKVIKALSRYSPEELKPVFDMGYQIRPVPSLAEGLPLLSGEADALSGPDQSQAPQLNYQVVLHQPGFKRILVGENQNPVRTNHPPVANPLPDLGLDDVVMDTINLSHGPLTRQDAFTTALKDDLADMQPADRDLVCDAVGADPQELVENPQARRALFKFVYKAIKRDGPLYTDKAWEDKILPRTSALIISTCMPEPPKPQE